MDLSDPEIQSKIIKEVYSGEDLYEYDLGNQPIILKEVINHQQRTYPDLIAIPFEGYDLKGNLWRDNLFEKNIFNGMHTYDDAFILLRNGNLPEKRFAITDISSIIYKILNVDNFELDADI